MLWLGLMLVGSMMVFIVPQFVSVFEQIKVPLPEPTRTLMVVSGAIQPWGGLVLVVPFLVAYPLGSWLSARWRDWVLPVIVLTTVGLLLLIGLAVFLPLTSMHGGIGS